jgi:hypothetical protein
LLGFDIMDVSAGDAAQDCVQSIFSNAESSRLEELNPYDGLTKAQIRRKLAAERRHRKDGIGCSPASADSSVSFGDVNVKTSLGGPPTAACSLLSPSPELESYLLLKCLRVERSALLFKYRSLWIEALKEHQRLLDIDLKTVAHEHRRPIAALIISRTYRMFTARKHYHRVGVALRLVQRISRGHQGREVFLRLRWALHLAHLGQRVGRAYAARLDIGYNFRDEIRWRRETAAATKIQSVYRMSYARDNYFAAKVEKKSAIKCQRAVRKWLQVHIRHKQRLASEAAAEQLQLRTDMCEVRSCETAERVLLYYDENVARASLLQSVCILAAAFNRLLFVEQLIVNRVNVVPLVLASSGIARSRLDLTTPVLASMVCETSSSKMPSQQGTLRTAKRRLQLQLIRQEQLETVARQLHIVMAQQSQRAQLREQHMMLLHQIDRKVAGSSPKGATE